VAEIDDRQCLGTTEPGVSAGPSRYFKTFAAIAAAPMMPAAFLVVAGMIGAFVVISGRKLSCDLLIPPPTINRSGLNRLSR